MTQPIPMYVKRHIALKKRLKQLNIDQAYLAKELECSVSHIERCMNGRASWTIAEIYSILDLIRAKPADIPTYFPRDGIYIKRYSPRTKTAFSAF